MLFFHIALLIITLRLFEINSTSMRTAVHWFRKGLRLHDNPALIKACAESDRIFPVFIIDPWFANPDVVGINRYSFLLDALKDLDESLRRYDV